MDGSQTPNIKFDQVEYPDPVRAPEDQAHHRQPAAAQAPAHDAGRGRAGRRRWLRHLLVCGRPSLQIDQRRLSRRRQRHDRAEGVGLRHRGRGRRQPEGQGRRRAGAHRSARLPDRARQRQGRSRERAGHRCQHRRPDQGAAGDDRAGPGRGRFLAAGVQALQRPRAHRRGLGAAPAAGSVGSRAAPGDARPPRRRIPTC